MADRRRAPLSRRRKAALAVAIPALTFLVLELLARLTMPAPLPWRYPQVRYRPDPDLFFVLRPDQQAFSADKPVFINHRGLRGAAVPYERAPARTRLLFLGDSIVFGFGVADEDVVSTRVARYLEAAGMPVEVINTAVPAYTAEQEVRYLEREGIRYAPDWVIVGVCWNDIADKSDARVSDDGWLIGPGDGRPPAPRESERPSAYALRNTLKRSRLLYASLQGWRTLQGSIARDRLTDLRAGVLEGRDSAEITAGLRRLESALERIQHLSAAHDFRLLVVAFPIPLALERSYPRSRYPAHLRAFAAQTGIPLIDLQEAFRPVFRGHDSLFIPYDGDHPNAAGHDLAARAIAAHLAAALHPDAAPRLQSAAAAPR